MKDPIKMTPGDDLHLTALMAPFSLNLVTGQDRQHLLGYGRSAFEAGAKCAKNLAIESAETPAARPAATTCGAAQVGNAAAVDVPLNITLNALLQAEAALEVAIARILKRDPSHSISVTSEAKALVIVRRALSAQAAPGLPEEIPASDTLWRLLTNGMTQSAIAGLPERDRKVLTERAQKNWATICAEAGATAPVAVGEREALIDELLVLIEAYGDECMDSQAGKGNAMPASAFYKVEAKLRAALAATPAAAPGKLGDDMRIRCRKCGEQVKIECNSARIVTHNPHTGKPRDARDIASDPEGKLIVQPGALLTAAPAPVALPEPVATIYTMEALVPGGAVKHHAQLLKTLPAGTKLLAEPEVRAALLAGVSAPAGAVDIDAAAKSIAIAVAKNCGSVPQLTFPDIYLGLKEFAASLQADARDAAPAASEQDAAIADMTPVWLQVDAEVRYWEDAEVNGEPDDHGDLIPLKQEDRWVPVIRLADGFIGGWPAGTTADIHYKVCDQGEYFLLNAALQRVAKYYSDYVPSILAVGDKGYGDYIILKVAADGFIEGWTAPSIDSEMWPAIAAQAANGGDKA